MKYFICQNLECHCSWIVYRLFRYPYNCLSNSLNLMTVSHRSVIIINTNLHYKKLLKCKDFL